MEALHKALGMDFPNNFEYRQGGDAHLTLELLHRLLIESGFKDAVTRTFCTNYSTVSLLSANILKSSIVCSTKLDDDMDIDSKVSDATFPPTSTPA